MFCGEISPIHTTNVIKGINFLKPAIKFQVFWGGIPDVLGIFSLFFFWGGGKGRGRMAGRGGNLSD